MYRFCLKWFIFAGLYRILDQAFDHVVIVNEYKTSQLWNKDTSVVLENYVVKILPQNRHKHNNRNTRALHTLLTSQGNPNSIIVNRDRNAARNIRSIFLHQIRTGVRPPAFARPARQAQGAEVEAAQGMAGPAQGVADVELEAGAAQGVAGLLC